MTRQKERRRRCYRGWHLRPAPPAPPYSAGGETIHQLSLDAKKKRKNCPWLAPTRPYDCRYELIVWSKLTASRTHLRKQDRYLDRTKNVEKTKRPYDKTPNTRTNLAKTTSTSRHESLRITRENRDVRNPRFPDTRIYATFISKQENPNFSPSGAMRPVRIE